MNACKLGIATRNGIMLISHYRHLMEEEGVSFRDAIVQGSMERLSPILMTALERVVNFKPVFRQRSLTSV